MLEQLTLALSPLVGVLAVVVVVIAGFLLTLAKGQSALTLTGLTGLVSPPVAVGVLGTGVVIATLTSGEWSGLVALAGTTIMAILTYLSNVRATAAEKAAAVAREATAAAVLAAKDAADAAREDRAAAAQAAKEVADAAREDRAAAARVMNEAADAAAIHAIALEKIRTSVDGVASRKDDEVSALKEIVASLRDQLAKEESKAATLAASQAATDIAKASAPAPVLAVLPKVEP